MAMIGIHGLSTVFGPRPQAALAQLQAGADKATLLAQGHTLALHDINLSIEPGEIFVIMGLSGSGKSTLVRHINRLVEPTAGRVVVDGQDMGALSPQALVAWRRQRLAMVFQGFGLLAHRDLIDNVALPLALRGMARGERHAQARQWIDRVGLSGYEHHRPAQLSGGMQQRVGLARALCAGTDIILMDEPFSALDPLTRAQLQRELMRLQTELGRTIVFITHDLDEALRLGKRIAVLRDGLLLQVAAPAELLSAPADAHVALFVRDVNRARALPITLALAPWPAPLDWPPLQDTIAADASIEQALPLLLGRDAPLAVRRGDAVIGQVSVAEVRRLLQPAAEPSVEP